MPLTRHLCLFVLLLIFTIGCRPSSAPQSRAQTASVPAIATSSQPDDSSKSESSSQVTVSDILDILQLRVWKSALNDNDEEAISRALLFAKEQDSKPKLLTSIDLEGQGTLLVSLQDMDDSRIKAGVTWNGADGHSMRSDVIVDDPCRDAIGLSSSPAAIAHKGVRLLRSANATSSDIATNPKASGLYLVLE